MLFEITKNQNGVIVLLIHSNRIPTIHSYLTPTVASEIEIEYIFEIISENYFSIDLISKDIRIFSLKSVTLMAS